VIKKFQKGDIELVTAVDSNHPKSDLEQHRTSLIEEFTQRPRFGLDALGPEKTKET